MALRQSWLGLLLAAACASPPAPLPDSLRLVALEPGAAEIAARSVPLASTPGAPLLVELAIADELWSTERAAIVRALADRGYTFAGTGPALWFDWHAPQFLNGPRQIAAGTANETTLAMIRLLGAGIPVELDAVPEGRVIVPGAASERATRRLHADHLEPKPIVVAAASGWWSIGADTATDALRAAEALPPIGPGDPGVLAVDVVLSSAESEAMWTTPEPSLEGRFEQKTGLRSAGGILFAVPVVRTTYLFDSCEVIQVTRTLTRRAMVRLWQARIPYSVELGPEGLWVPGPLAPRAAVLLRRDSRLRRLVTFERS